MIEITASNGVSPDAIQDFTLTVGAAPQITSADQTEIDLGSSGSFTVTATGDPVPAMTESGALPSGITFQDNGNGTATISGTPNEDNGPVEGTYPITLTASQTGGTWPAATQAFTLTVGGGYVYTGFYINSTGTDGTALNPGMGLAVNGSACYNQLDGTVTFPQCGPGLPNSSYFSDNVVANSRECAGGDPLPLAVNPALMGGCYQRQIAYDPADTLTVSTPVTTTVGTAVYTFDHWDTSGQSVPCDGGNASTSCTFEVPQSGVDLTAIYDPPSACPAGFFSATGLEPCIPAPQGSYDAGSGNTAPALCGPGTYSASQGSAGCTDAPAGSFDSGSGNTEAALCGPGTYSASQGSASCTDAPAGSSDSGSGNTEAALCGPGTYSASQGSASCTDAPAGSFDSGSGNTGAALCGPGTYSASQGSASCTDAPAGSFDSGSGNTGAALCGPGTYSASQGSASCTDAPAGSYDSGSGNTAAAPCPAGTNSSAGASACTATSVALTYNGPSQVAVSSSFAPTAVLSASSPACVSGQPVSFSLSTDPLNGTAGPYSLGSGDASGTGSVTNPSVNTAGWENGVYTITASYAGATVGAVICPAARTSASLAVTVPGQVAFGDGLYNIPNVGQTSFGFVVALKPHTTNTYLGQLAVVVPGKWWYQANVTSYGKTSSVQGLLGGTGALYWWDTALNHGQGAWQLAESGVTYTTTANASTKSAPASFGITINYTPSPPQPTTLPNSAPLAISNGVIVIS